MPPHPLAFLSYRRHHVLTAEDARWDIQAEWRLRGRGNPPSPNNHVKFDLEISSLDANWQTAIGRARRLDSALLDGVPVRLELRTVDLQFQAGEAEPWGHATFDATLDAPIPFPWALDDAELASALATAGALAGELRIQADEIDRTERYWTFPIQEIGATGIVVERSTGRAFMTGGSMKHAMWIWAYEHRLLDEPAGDLIVEQIFDLEQAFTALRAFARVLREDVQTLPLVLDGCATWLAARPLMEASTALAWRVAPRAG